MMRRSLIILALVFIGSATAAALADSSSTSATNDNPPTIVFLDSAGREIGREQIKPEKLTGFALAAKERGLTRHTGFEDSHEFGNKGIYGENLGEVELEAISNGSTAALKRSIISLYDGLYDLSGYEFMLPEGAVVSRYNEAARKNIDSKRAVTEINFYQEIQGVRSDHISKIRLNKNNQVISARVTHIDPRLLPTIPDQILSEAEAMEVLIDAVASITGFKITEEDLQIYHQEVADSLLGLAHRIAPDARDGLEESPSQEQMRTRVKSLSMPPMTFGIDRHETPVFHRKMRYRELHINVNMSTGEYTLIPQSIVKAE